MRQIPSSSGPLDKNDLERLRIAQMLKAQRPLGKGENVKSGGYIPGGKGLSKNLAYTRIGDVIDGEVVSEEKSEGYAGVPQEVVGTGDLARKKSPVGGSEAATPTSRRKYTLGVVDTTDQIGKMARDAADRNLTASAEELKGFKGFLKKVWKHNIFNEYYRQKEIIKAKKKIAETGNAFANEDLGMDAHDAAQRAVTERFIQAFEDESLEREFLHDGEEGRKLEDDETDGDLKRDLKDLVLNYAQGSFNDESFSSQKEALFARMNESGGRGGAKGRMYADNLLDIAKEVRKAVAHGQGIDQLDIDFDVVVGRARTGVRTEAQLGAVDRITDKIQKSLVGRFANETTIALGVAAAYSAGSYVSQRIASSKLAAWGTFGASALLGGGIAAARESRRLEMERAQHTREAAQGRTFEPGSARRAEMEGFRHETRSAAQLTEELRAALYEQDSSGGIRTRDLDEAGMRQAAARLAEIESRIKMSDSHRIDLIGYSGSGNVERERFDLDLARAKAKVDMRKICREKGLTFADTGDVDALIATLTQERGNEMRQGDQGIEAKDRIFKKMKRAKMAKKAVTAVAVGLAIGATARDLTSFFDDDRTGIVEEMLVGKQAYGAGADSVVPQGAAAEAIPAGKEDESAEQGVAGIRDGLGDMEQMRKNYSGDLIQKLQEQQGVSGDSIKGAYGGAAAEAVSGTKTVYEDILTTKRVSPQDYLQNNPDARSVHRGMWFDNNTRRADLNELGLRPGGVQGTGLDKNGNFVYSIKEMARGISRHGQISEHMRQLMESGKLKMLFSLSGDSSNRVLEVPIDANGQAVIDPNSPIGKLLFRNNGGKMEFLGKYAEVAQIMGNKNGVDEVRIYATGVGKGLDGVDVQVTERVPREIPDVKPQPVPAPQEAPRIDPLVAPMETGEVKPIDETELPPIIPILSRKPLEPSMRRKLEKESRDAYMGAYGYFGYGRFLDSSEYRERALDGINGDPEFDVIKNDDALAEEYLAKQDPAYLAELEQMIGSLEPMKESVDASVIIPSGLEAKNIEKTLTQYGNMNSQERFEIVIFENHTNDKQRDETAAIIDKVRKQYPNLNIAHLYKTFDGKPYIGKLRKYIVDSTLLRKRKAGIKKSTVFVSNDADANGASPDYMKYILEDFENGRLDAVAGKMDFPKEAFEKLPLLHASQRAWDYFMTVIRHAYGNNPELRGANSAFRSGIYSAVGGYNERSELGEDLEIGWMIKAARGGNKGRIRYDNRMSLVTSARRPAIKLLEGGSLADQYEDFHKNERVRTLPLEEMLNEKRDMDWDHFKSEIQRMYSYYAGKKVSKGGWIDDDVMENTFRRSMFFLGVEYRVNGDTVEILDTSRLRAGLGRARSNSEGAGN